MKEKLLEVINEYLDIFPDESERQEKLINYLNEYNDENIYDWNNFDGHITVGGFIYSKKLNKFLVLFHRDLKMYLYPGGHVDFEDRDLLYAVKREIKEETGLTNLKQFIFNDDKLIPIDIDTHLIEYNSRLNLPEHFHFDFRYLFFIDEYEGISIDEDEILKYKWIDLNELYNDNNYGNVAIKIKNMIY